MNALRFSHSEDMDSLKERARDAVLQHAEPVYCTKCAHYDLGYDSYSQHRHQCRAHVASCAPDFYSRREAYGYPPELNEFNHCTKYQEKSND